MANPTALDDPRRLRTLREAVLLDTPAEEAFDRLTGLAARILDAPVSLVSLVDEDRQFFKSCFGLPEPWASARETPLSHSYCQHAVTTGEPLIIDDAREHPLVRDNPAIRDLNAIAYAGIPLELDGQTLGSFCVVDDERRHWTEREVDILSTLAESVMAEIQLRVTTRELERAARDREEVMGIVSHDLRSPLAVVVAASELLKHPRLTEERRERQIEIIRRAGKRMLRLTGDLLDLARLDAGALDLKRRPVAVGPLLRDAAELAVAGADPHADLLGHEPRDVAVTLETPPDDVTVSLDEDRVHQAVGNLLNNALRVTSGGGRVTLRGALVDAGATGAGAASGPAGDRSGRILRIEVEDTGPGIPADELHSVFDRYFQGDDATRGTAGLGLTMVRAIVEAHGGNVWAESEAGKGARFIMEVPAEA